MTKSSMRIRGPRSEFYLGTAHMVAASATNATRGSGLRIDRDQRSSRTEESASEADLGLSAT
jgi:hypothetical protein